MFSLKNKLIILLSLSFVFPLGGIGISGLNNFITYDMNESVESFDLSFQDNGPEIGANFFIYYDALPFDLAYLSVVEKTGVKRLFLGSV